MLNRRAKTGAGHSRGWWPLLFVLLLAVLVPTACVLWFMTEAMRNERLAVRQKLIDVCRDRAVAARKELEDYWSAKAAALRDAGALSAPEAFARLVLAGVADSVVVYDDSGEVAYPAPAGHPLGEPFDDPPQWREANRLEYELGQADNAAQAYAGIAEASEDAHVKARALRAGARCLLRAGRKQQALAILSGPLADDRYRNATDTHGRLIAPNALMLALQLTDRPDGPAFNALAERLAGRLNDYGDPAISSAQRRFLMRALQEIRPTAPAFPTLAAEDLAADYLDAPRAKGEALRLTKAGPGDVWQLASADTKIVALFGGESLLGEMRSAGRLGEPFAGMRLQMVPPRPASAKIEAFFSVAAARHLPGWELEVRPLDEAPFTAAAGRQTAAYLWTGMLGVLIIAVLGLIAGGYVSRQMKLARLKNDLIATVSHELKTPLASMRVLVDTLLDDRCRDQGQAREYFQLIAKENERLSRLIDNFLTFSRMERNKRAFELARLDVDQIVGAAVGSVRDRFARPGCRLDVDVAPGLPAVSGDRDALTTVVINLLDNAYKYSEEDKRIVLRAYADDAHVCLEVSDNGVGLSRRATRRIFDRFYQADRSLSRGAGGCGLGLSIVKFVVDAHGGQIDVASQPGKGSTFTVKLPIADATTTAESDNDDEKNGE